jgi:catechol 2,3-dioxygenase-like lactoylglutathione lyase family enzyme
MFKMTHPIIGTRDINRAIEFYTQRLGFQLAFRDTTDPPKSPVGREFGSWIFGSDWVIAFVLAYAAKGSPRARAQSAVADGARARNGTFRVHGINATSVTAHKPPFPSPLAYPLPNSCPSIALTRME